MSVNSVEFYLGGNIRNIYILLLLSLSFGTVTDIDGNVYETVIIGDQLWMAENLKVIHYRNGDEILTDISAEDWCNLTEGGYVTSNDNYVDVYGNIYTETYSDAFGNLYNWYAADDDRGLCPAGWHIPSDDEWKGLEIYLGMPEEQTDNTGWRGEDEGAKLKDEGLNYWGSSNDEGTNTSGFTALGGGLQNCWGTPEISGIHHEAFFLSSTEDGDGAWYRRLHYAYSSVYRGSHYGSGKEDGFAIRCIEDIIEGCTNPEAYNYNPDATIDDGNCCIELWGECYSIENTTNFGINNGFYDEIPDGPIDPNIGELINLTSLSINGLGINGSIPNEIGNLINLELLAITNTQIGGAIPSELGELTHLTVLRFYYNELAGLIPPQIGELTQLTELMLYNNQLEGSIPPEICFLTDLSYLLLNHNSLTGEIPPEIDNLTNLFHLGLGDNQFTGLIPLEICNIFSNLWSPIFHNNNFCPIYPECLTEENIGYQDTSECDDILGCTDSEATNYYPDATLDDGSCWYCDLGEINCDGELNILDIVLAANMVLADEYDEIADVNEDGNLNILDLVILVNWVLFPCMDYDGNVYQTVLIGDQVWMAENLKTTHYNDGTEIPSGHSFEMWDELETGAYTVYPTDDDEASQSTCGDDCAEVYGNLYNWYVVDDDRGICPEGFHVPSDEQFMELEIELGMSEEEATSEGFSRGTDEYIGSKLAGNNLLWTWGSIEDNSEFGSSGYNGYPAGYFSNTGHHVQMGTSGTYWTSSFEQDTWGIEAWYRQLGSYSSGVYRILQPQHAWGFSIRCLKN